MPFAVNDKTYAVVMAGGSGTRFWPASRQTRPKQLLSLVTEKSLLIETVTRIAPGRVPFDRVLVVVGPHLAAATRAVVEPLGCRVVVEPMARNTAPCIALAAAIVAAETPDGVMAVLPADQHISDVKGYGDVFDRAATVAATGRIATVGIVPTHPETGYGYTRCGDKLSDGVYQVDAFVEKPDLETAKKYVADEHYHWNAGMFFMRADVLLEAVGKHMPKLAEGIGAYRAAMGSDGEHQALVTCFETCEAISIDYGVMEREAENIAVVPGDFGWSDVGSWRTVLDFREDGATNFVRGDVTSTDSTDCVLVSEGPHVAVIGMKGVAVVVTGDAVLVAPLDRAQEVGAHAKALRQAGREELV